MQRGAKIGFHAAYIENRASRTESGVGNALVGSYLTQIGLPETAVIYVTKAAPTQLTLLTLQDAQRIGIEVLPFEQYAPTTEPAQRITPRGREELALDCGAAQSTPRDNDPDPIYKTKIAVTDEVIYVEHYAASGKTFSRNEQYRDQKFWRGEKTDNWSGVSVRRPDRTMVGSIRIDNGGQRAEYTERLYRGGKLEVTIVSMCRLIRTTAAPRTPPPAKPATPTPPDPSETSRRDSDVNTCSQGNSRDALNACSQLINLSGLNLGDLTIAYLRRAQLYFSNGDYDRAIADFSAFIRLRPNSVVAFNERGLSFGKKGDYDKAIADYTEAIRLNPVWSALPYYNRGSAYEKKGELEKALADFREALNKGSTTVSEDINRVEWAIESLRKEKSREIIWKNYPHLNDDDKRALAIYPEILPPPEYDYPRILINWLDGLTHEELAAYCNNAKAISPPTKTFVRDTLVGRARGERNPCRIYLAREDVITAAGLTLNLVKRHMIGRCNGWPDDHAGAR